MQTSFTGMPGNLSRAKKWRRKKDLKQTLLAIGGKEVVWLSGDVPYLHELVAGGRLFYEQVRLRRCDGDQSRQNAARLWGQSFGRYHLVTGFALGADGRWVPHGWLLGREGKKQTAYVYETTGRKMSYYGFILAHAEAVHFWIRDCLWGCGEGPLRAFCGIGTLDDLYGVLQPARALDPDALAR
jgi:hypothetical protein